MKLTIYRIMKVVKIFETIMKYVMVACWAACLLSGGVTAIVAAAFGIVACALTCIV